MTGARRIAVMGGAGAGKSTLAGRLGETLDLPVIHLDLLMYGPGWTPRDLARDQLSDLIEAGGWVVEGTYAEAAALVLPRADVVLWLDQPPWRRLWRAWRKTRIHRGRPRADRPEGCEEQFGLTYIGQVLSFGGWSPGLERWLRQATSGSVIRLRGDRAIARFVAEAADGPGYLAGGDAVSAT
jgi:NADPH-dependent 2,4-dienoyl-CoA reductase/sulfur reductase-like enzyme